MGKDIVHIKTISITVVHKNENGNVIRTEELEWDNNDEELSVQKLDDVLTYLVQFLAPLMQKEE